MRHPYMISEKGNALYCDLMASPKLSVIHLYPTKMIRFLDNLQKMILWSQVLGVVLLSIRRLLEGY